MAIDIASRRVVVTGIGLVSPIGSEIETFWDALLSGVSGIGQITHFDTTDYPCTIAGEVKDFDPTPAFANAKEVRRTDRFTQLAMYAGWQTIQDSGIDLDSVDRDEIGAFIGSGIGGLTTTEAQHKILLEKGPRRVSPFIIPMLILNMGSGVFSMRHNLRGPNIATCSACATSTHAVGEAWRSIKMGDASAIFAGGSEAAIIPLGIAGFSAMKALSFRNAEPTKASRPFDADREGFVMGEGAAILLLEELEHAKARDAKIYCEIVGYGNTADAYHLTAPSPHGEGAARCMSRALKTAGLNPDAVDYINAHGTSTPQGDICETQAIRSVFGDHADTLSVSSTKGHTGHMLGAAGATEMAACALAIQRQIVPPTINYETPDPECDLDYTPNTPKERRVRVTVNNSFGFGGHNATIVAKAFDG